MMVKSDKNRLSDERNLWHIRSFYLTFLKVNALRSELIFVSLRDRTRKIKHFTDDYKRNSLTKSPQSSGIPVTTYEKAAASRFITRIARIYTYPCVSASSVQSAFYYTLSSFCVHPRLILSMQEKTTAFYYALLNKANTIFNQKSDLHDRHFLLQRT